MARARNRFGCAETLRLSRTNYWTAYLNKQKVDPNVDENTRWDEYYRAKTSGIYKTSHLARIENRLNAYTVADGDEMELINRFFVHNTEKLASWRMLYIQMSELKKSALYDTLTSREERAAQNVLMENMRWIAEIYFTWQAYRFREPLDNYAWIRDNYEYLASLLTRGIEDPNRYSMARNLLVQLQFLCSNIYRVGAVHKFRHLGNDLEDDRSVI